MTPSSDMEGRIYRMAAIGSQWDFELFKAIGCAVFDAADAVEGHAIVMRLAREGYGIVFLEENLSLSMEATINEYKDRVVPAIIVVPGHSGTQGIGSEALMKSMERAVGIRLPDMDI